MKRMIGSSRLLLILVLVCGFAIGYITRNAFAADTRFTTADAALAQAVNLLVAADVGDKTECNRFRTRAIALAEKARIQISKAIACIDEP